MLYLPKENNQSFMPEEKGQGIMEYALVLILVSIVIIAVLALLGPQIGVVFSNVRCTLANGGDTTARELCKALIGG